MNSYFHLPQADFEFFSLHFYSIVNVTLVHINCIVNHFTLNLHFKMSRILKTENLPTPKYLIRAVARLLRCL